MVRKHSIGNELLKFGVVFWAGHQSLNLQLKTYNGFTNVKFYIEK